MILSAIVRLNLQWLLSITFEARLSSYLSYESYKYIYTACTYLNSRCSLGYHLLYTTCIGASYFITVLLSRGEADRHHLLVPMSVVDTTSPGRHGRWLFRLSNKRTSTQQVCVRKKILVLVLGYHVSFSPWRLTLKSISYLGKIPRGGGHPSQWWRLITYDSWLPCFRTCNHNTIWSGVQKSYVHYAMGLASHNGTFRLIA